MSNGPIDVLNAYGILNLKDLSWDVSTYAFTRIDGRNSDHEERGTLKSTMWELRNQNKNLCTGYGFVIDLDEFTVAIPQNWKIPEQANFNGYKIVLKNKFKAIASNSQHSAIVSGLLREGIKKHFKDNPSAEKIGYLWQDFGNFCQMPNLKDCDQEVIYCRRFEVSPELLAGGQWVLQMEVTTASFDGKTFGDYYNNGDVQQLAKKIKLKQADRLTRQNLPPAIRVWRARGESYADVLELENPEEIFKQALLSQREQRDLVNRMVRCKLFNKPPIDVPLREIRLISETKFSQQRHSDTIINPPDRLDCYNQLRDYFDGMDVYGKTVQLAEQPVKVHQFDNLHFILPALLVHKSSDGINRIEAPKNCSQESLKSRMRTRSNHVRRYGFVQDRPVKFLLTYRKDFGEQRAKRLQKDLNWIVEQQGLKYRFEDLQSVETVSDIEAIIREKDHDTLLAVLPESRNETYSDQDTHEQIKKRIAVPSQCIHYDNTLPSRWVDKSWRDFKEADQRYARNIEDHYKQCILNLLVKHNWVPFVPAEPFHYNVHIGIDVGGKHNNRVMVCAGYGFMQPAAELIFLPKEVNVQTQKAEPIPSNHLFEGLLAVFQELYDCLSTEGIKPDFGKVLFFRDGQLRLHDWNALFDARHCIAFIGPCSQCLWASQS